MKGQYVYKKMGMEYQTDLDCNLKDEIMDA